MRILLSALSFQPDFGGPARSVPQLATALADLGMDVGLWAPDGSATQSPLLKGATRLHLLDGPAEAAWRAFGKVDVLHDNGIWRPHHLKLMTLAETQGAARILSARGMLTIWTFNHKPVRKRLAWWTYQRRSVNRASALHATAEAEAEGFRSLGLRPPVRIIPNGISLPPWDEVETARKTGPADRTCLYMSRLNPTKGIPLLLEAWARLRPEGWRLHIAGPDENGYKADLDNVVKRLGLGPEVRFLGAVEGGDKLAELARADVLVLPTYTENFGIVVAEALAHGCPVVTTHGAPWRILETESCGWWVPVSVDGIAGALQEAMSKGRAELRAMGDRGRACVDRHFSWSDIARRSIELYEVAAG